MAIVILRRPEARVPAAETTWRAPEPIGITDLEAGQRYRGAGAGASAACNAGGCASPHATLDPEPPAASSSRRSRTSRPAQIPIVSHRSSACPDPKPMGPARSLRCHALEACA